MENRRIKYFALLLACFVILALASCAQKKMTDKELFEKFIFKPIPPSVLILKAQYSRGTIDGGCVLIFKVAPNDFNKILTAKNFKKTDLVDLKLPKPFADWSSTEREMYFYKPVQRTEMYKLITNNQHNLVYFVYSNY